MWYQVTQIFCNNFQRVHITYENTLHFSKEKTKAICTNETWVHQETKDKVSQILCERSTILQSLITIMFIAFDVWRIVVDMSYINGNKTKFEKLWKMKIIQRG